MKRRSDRATPTAAVQEDAVVFPRARLANQFFYPLLALGILIRACILADFGFNRVSEDDAIIWSAAVDYGHLIFRWPYFYGQDYGVMLEALVAAPFARLGISLNILMPTVTSLLALLPFWSFAAWHRRQGRPLTALAFLAMPVLLPAEYGMMTTLTRGFVPGIALLALLPWTLFLRNSHWQAFATGSVVGAAALVNPNSLVFSSAFLTWYVFHRDLRIASAAMAMVGLVPFLGLHLAAQAFCRTHPERVVHAVNGWQLGFHPGDLLPESFAMLGSHFQWLFPFPAGNGSLAFILLCALALWHLLMRNRPLGIGLLAAVLLIIASFALPKVHDGFNSLYFPYSRMFLAVPLLLCWGLGTVDQPVATPRWLLFCGMAACTAATVVTLYRIPALAAARIPGFIPVNEIRMQSARADLSRLLSLKQEHAVQLVTGSGDWNEVVNVRLRCYLYPILNPAFGPTYMHSDRRYWQRDKYGGAVVSNLMLIDVPENVRLHWPHSLGRLIDVSDSLSGPVHVLIGNKLPTDSLIDRMQHFEIPHL